MRKTMAMALKIKIYSNNINGFNSPNKRSKVWHLIKKGKYDVICLQETHIMNKHVAHLTQKSLGTTYHASCSEKKRGVVTYVNEKIKSKKVFNDQDGRMLGVRLEIEGKILLICNIYAPNGSKTQFIEGLHQKILEQEYDDLLIMGDFNGVVNSKLDKSDKGKGKKGKVAGELPRKFKEVKEDLGLIDIWRHQHAEERDFTFLSNRHLTWSRIDMIWGTRTITNEVTRVKILPRTNSDHAPIEMVIESRGRREKEYRWKLNDVLLKNESDQNKYRMLLEEYFKLNRQEDTPIDIIWDASKAYIRGFLIEHNARMNRLRKAKHTKILKEIDKLESELKVKPRDKEIKLKIEIAKKEWDALQVEEMGKKLKYIKQYNFENANKVGKWLARRLAKKRQANIISKIKDGGNVYYNNEGIGKQFIKFYEKLYSEDKISKDKVTQYLGKQEIPRITEDQREILNRKITNEEIYRAIQRTPPNKAPGPDGFTMRYYRIFQETLVKPLQQVMNKALEEGKIPATWKEANITLLPKDKADSTNVKSYRPISLLNADYKIFTSILAARLKEVLKDRIKEEQAGFLPGRQMKENTRNILGAIEYYDKNPQKEIAFLFLDAEKAFDNVNWFCIMEILREMDAGFYFTNAVKAVYCQQTARIITNGHLSSSINIEKGTRQGCPLSPLLFIMTLEVLLESIRKNKDLQGLRIRNHCHKIRAFADDIVCLIEDPLKQFKIWWETIMSFGEVAGLKINREKTKILIKNMSQKNIENLQKISGIEVVKKIRYLGIELTASNAQLQKNNYEKKWREMKDKMKRWGSLKLSLLGKIAAVKMKILPEVLFLFQNIPILRNKGIIRGWQREINKFIWEGKKARIAFKYLKDDIRRGGMGLPDLLLYYEAASLNWVKDWATLKENKTIDLEGYGLNKGWHSYLWQEKTRKEKNFKHHYIRAALLEVWEKYKRRFYTKVPMWYSPIEAEHKRELPRRRWLTYSQLLNTGNQGLSLKSYEELKQLEPSITWLNYWQIKESFKEDNKIGFERRETGWDRVLKVDRKTIKILYQQLLMWDTEEVQIKEVMTKWAREVGHTISMSEWERIWNKNLKYTYAAEIKENWYKIFYRWYLTPGKLAKMNKGKGDGKCWKCEKHIGDWMHMWWKCKKVKNYWQTIHKEMEKIIQKKFEVKPEYFLLGILDFSWDCNTEKLFIYMVTAARICLAKVWKTKETPSKEDWTLKLLDIQNMDLLTQALKQDGTTGRETNWSQLSEYMKKEIMS
uniref:Reverse transcriptase domain-containing protein n=1 Tax=Anolis carolinensis TaxID=28377 RepID=A0A803SLC5_ANOCA